MKKLFLCSYLAGVKKLAGEFLYAHTTQKIINFVPTAADGEVYRDYVDEAKTVFAELGYQIHILDLANADRTQIIAALAESRALYVSGGNVFYLLSVLKKHNLLAVLQEKIHSGMPYLGESAGAMIAAADIEYAQIMDDKNAAELTDTQALGVVDFYPVPHFGEFPFEQSAAETLCVYGSQLNLTAINNTQAIIVNGNILEAKTA